MSAASKLFDLLVFYPLFRTVHVLGALPARLGMDRFTRGLMRSSARSVLMVRQAKRKETAQAIGLEWKRMFPLGERYQHFLSGDDDTVYYETTVSCPLRGSGDTRACYRLMEFDRAMLERIGGQLVVVRSQAEAGVDSCKVAIRRAELSLTDLTHAHDKE